MALRLLRRYLRISWSRLINYPSNLALVLIYWVLSLSLMTVFWQVAFLHLPKVLGEWDFPKLIILNSFCYIAWGIFTLFWGFSELPGKVLSGEIDKYLSRPIPLLFGVLGEGFYLEACYEIAVGLLAASTVLITYHIPLGWTAALLSAVAVILGSSTIVLVYGCLSLLTFWFGRIERLQALLVEFDEYQRYPIEFFPSSVRFLLCYILPLYFPASFAVRVLLGMKYETYEFEILGLLFLFWLSAFQILSRRCLRVYASAN